MLDLLLFPFVGSPKTNLPVWSQLFLTHQRHVLSVPRELSVDYKVNSTLLEDVLQGGHVVGVLRPVLGQTGHLPPVELLHGREVGVPDNIYPVYLALLMRQYL